MTVDGLAAVDMARRYLPTRPIPRLVAAELQWIHQELVLGAKRHDDAKQRARLTRILERPLPPPPALPAKTVDSRISQRPRAVTKWIIPFQQAAISHGLGSRSS